ncbi:SH3 domain-containing protein [Streptomyces sp. NBC_00582]|uniref:SH3 domain-containing protein n=1 Tax=Streptomyces sp. NBC_00582 TaxID=2975783 RepID=UPI002E804A75|nr:SH3 domain-containing protein [Streptomyces sp. NBC_00582]WUB68367.1 SH3 domain-containing protein [Streptomyces sp. NBC_00582]
MQARLATAAALTTAFIAAGAVAAAPASAAAENNVRDYNTTIVGSSGVNYRTGPGTGYTSKGLVATGDKITVTATSNAGGACYWYKAKLRAKSRNGLPKGTVGWVNWVYVQKLVPKGTQGC